MINDYSDHDPNITVISTGPNEICIAIFVGNDVWRMHVRSDVDLNQKLSKAVLDCIGEQVQK